MTTLAEKLFPSSHSSVDLITHTAEPKSARLLNSTTLSQYPHGRISSTSPSDLKKSPTQCSLDSANTLDKSSSLSLRSRSSSTSSGISAHNGIPVNKENTGRHITTDLDNPAFFLADTYTGGEEEILPMHKLKFLWEPIEIPDTTSQENEAPSITEITLIDSVPEHKQRRESTNPLNLVIDQDKPTIAITASEENLRNARHLNKATANIIQAGSAHINPNATPSHDTKPIDMPSDSGLGFSFAAGLEAIFGLWGALKGVSEAKNKIKEIPLQCKSELERINRDKIKKTAQRDIKINTTVATRYSLSGMLSTLRIGNFSATLKQGATAALAKLSIVISFIAAPLAVFAAAITAYSIHRDRKSISKSNQINDAAKILQKSNKGIEISAILECIRSKQNIKTKKASLITNILSLGGYLTLGTGASLMLAYTVGGIASVASAAALVTPIGWGLAGAAALAGIGLGIYKYVSWRQHKIEKQNASPDELLKISGAAAISRLLELTQDTEETVQNAAKSVLSQFMTNEEVNQLSTDDESFKFVARKLNIPVKIKKPAIETMQQRTIRIASV